MHRVYTLLRAFKSRSEDVEEDLNNMPYDAVHEKLRKKQLGLLLARTQEEVEEEEFVVAEMKKINQVCTPVLTC